MKTKKIYPVIFFLIVIGLVFHSQFSFCQTDESFYISMTHRLSQGDNLILDEWHPTQFYSPLLLPFYNLFSFVMSSNQGIILYYRVLTIFFSAFVCWLFFCEMKRLYNALFSFCAAIIFLLFTRANIAGASYYKLCGTFVILAYTLLIRSERKVKPASYILRIIAGMIISFAVLCQPFLAVFAILAGIVGFVKKDTRFRILQIFLGILIAAGWYILSFLSKGTINEYLLGIKYVLSDPQHQLSFISWLYAMATSHFNANSIIAICFIICLTGYVVWNYKKKKILPRAFFCFQCLVLCLSIIKPLIKIHNVPCYSYLGSLAIASFPFFLYLTLQKKASRTIALYYIGIILAISFSLGSNTGYDAMLTGYHISAAAMILEIGTLQALVPKNQNSRNKKSLRQIIFKNSAIILCCILMIITGIQRTFGFYRDAPIGQMTERIEQGPAAGLLTTEQHAEEYNSIYNIMNSQRNVTDKENTKLICSKLIPWVYLCSDLRCGAPSTWAAPVSSQMLIDYIDIHNPCAMYVAIFTETVGSYDSCFLNNHHERHNMNSQIIDGDFYERIQREGIIVYKDKQMTLYNLKE